MSGGATLGPLTRITDWRKRRREPDNQMMEQGDTMLKGAKILEEK